jgi:hypothetical protein
MNLIIIESKKLLCYNICLMELVHVSESHTFLSPYSMKDSPSWEADSPLAGYDITRVLRDPYF